MIPGANIPILLVEDNEDDQLLIERAFVRTQLRNPLHIVEDGETALLYLDGAAPYADRARFPLPGLILLDLKLPGRSGFDVLQWVRAQPGYVGRTPVVILTSSAEHPDVSRAYDLHANSYLRKPVLPSDLLTLVEALGRYWFALNEGPPLGP